MRRHSRSVAVALFLFKSSLLLNAQITGYTLQETVFVPVTGAAVVSQTPLAQGVVYKLRTVGVANVDTPGFFGSYQETDAEYAFDPAGFPWFGTDEDFCFQLDIGLAVNDTTNEGQKTPTWGGYNDAHVYMASFTGAGAPITINYHNCSYAGSNGVLTVQILRPMGMTLSATGQPPFTDVSPQVETFPRLMQNSSSGRANALALGPDGKRMYAGTFAGIWRSDDAGMTWRQMTQPQPPPGVDAVPGALFVPDIYDIAISPQNPDIVMVAALADLHATSMEGIYRSEDGGNTWALNFACPSGLDISQIVFAPDDPNLVYAAGACGIAESANGGKNWALHALPGNALAWHVAVAPYQPPEVLARAVAGIGVQPIGVRRVYALGDKRMYYSTNGGESWTQDSSISTLSAAMGGETTSHNGNSSHVLQVEPTNYAHVLVAAPGGSNGPSYYDNPTCGSPSNFPDGTTCNVMNSDGMKRGCGEGSVWLGDFTNFSPSDPSHQAATWTQLPSPPTYWGVTSPSGNVYANVRPVNGSYLLFLADMSHVHVSAGLPVAGRWHRMEGRDPSEAPPPSSLYCNQLLVHADPHALVTSPDFSMTLDNLPAGTPSPYNENTVAGPVSTGDIWMANDGGVYHAKGAARAWEPASGLTTLAAINIAGVAVKGMAPALYFGAGDNADFYSLDGGLSWNVPHSYCGDCDAWFADPAQVQQVMGFMPLAGGGGYYVFTNNGKYPDAQGHPVDGTTFAHWYCPNSCNASSSYWLRGYRPMVLTPPGTTAPPTGDYIIIGTKSNGTRVVFRKTNAAPVNAATDWENPNNAVEYGPTLPPCGSVTDCVDVVQASGGHEAPVLYAGDPAASTSSDPRSHYLKLWKWTPSPGAVSVSKLRYYPGATGWQQIVPSPTGTPPAQSATYAYRFYVDPFDPNTIYLMDYDAIKRSDDGGATWAVDVSLDNAITENHRYSYLADFSVLKDLIFVRGEDKTRFAVGNAGVFYTVDGGNWRRLLSTSAFPGHPLGAYFDNISDPCDRALYVAFSGRGIVRIDPIPSFEPIGIGGLLPCNDEVLHAAK